LEHLIERFTWYTNKCLQAGKDLDLIIDGNNEFHENNGHLEFVRRRARQAGVLAHYLEARRSELKNSLAYVSSIFAKCDADFMDVLRITPSTKVETLHQHLGVAGDNLSTLLEHEGNVAGFISEFQCQRIADSKKILRLTTPTTGKKLARFFPAVGRFLGCT